MPGTADIPFHKYLVTSSWRVSKYRMFVLPKRSNIVDVREYYFILIYRGNFKGRMQAKGI